VAGDAQRSGGCDQDSCGLAVWAWNDGGPPEGQPAVTITAETKAGAPITSCDAPLPAVLHGQQAKGTCTVRAPA
jgi:hypothetical protein